jgi:hypothetical protein
MYIVIPKGKNTIDDENTRREYSYVREKKKKKSPMKE